MKNDHELRKEILGLAEWIQEGEPMTAVDAAIDFSKLLGRILVDKNQTAVSLALITLALARYIEKNL